MKYLKYLLGVLFLLTVLFFLLGMITPTVSYESSVTVNKSAAESWAVMSDESKMSQWIKGYIKSELVSGKPNAIGSISNVYVEENGEEMVMQETITDFKENKLLAMKFSMDIMDMDYKITFDQMDGKTVVKSISKTEGNGMFAKSLISLIKGSMKAQEDENLNNLKNLIDNNQTNYFEEPVIMEPIIEQENDI